MEPIDKRYWIKLHSRSQPIETINLKNIKNDLERNPHAVIIFESIYPDYHEFKVGDTTKKVYGEMTDVLRNEYITKLFNKSEQYSNQVMRKKTTVKLQLHKNKKCKCK